MAMRYTDTTKWEGTWFRCLTPKLKCVWTYICDTCDGVGVVRLDLGLLSFLVGDKIELEEIKDAFSGRVYWLSNEKLWIAKALPFHQRKLSPKNRIQRTLMEKYISLASQVPHLDEEVQSIVAQYKILLEEYIEAGARVSHESRTKVVRPSIEDRGLSIEDRELVFKRESAEREISKPTNDTAAFNNRFKFGQHYNDLYEVYPRREKKGTALTWMQRHLTTPELIERFGKAIKHYRARCEREQVPLMKILLFTNFTLEWEEWEDPNHGTSTIQVKKEKSFLELVAEREVAGT